MNYFLGAGLSQPTSRSKKTLRKTMISPMPSKKAKGKTSDCRQNDQHVGTPVMSVTTCCAYAATDRGGANLVADIRLAEFGDCFGATSSETSTAAVSGRLSTFSEADIQIEGLQWSGTYFDIAAVAAGHHWQLSGSSISMFYRPVSGHSPYAAVGITQQPSGYQFQNDALAMPQVTATALLTRVQSL